MKTLIIAEKPSLGKTIAEHIGITKKNEGYLECKNNYLVTWLFGHIIELEKDMKVYNPEWGKWNYAYLPMILLENEFKYNVKPECKKQFKIIKDLVHSKDITTLINAGDPDREGQTLVDETIEYLKNKKPTKRILLHSLNQDGLEKGFKTIKDNKEFYNLYQSGKARAFADILVGYNLTRAFTLFAKDKNISSGMVSIGRVQTPTLIIIVDRYLKNKNFKTSFYYKIYNTFEKDNISFLAELKTETPIENKELAQSIMAKTAINGEVLSVVKKEGHEKQPLGFSLSQIQAKMNAKYGTSADKTLKIMQSLYEKKLTTYPRTDCQYLPENMQSELSKIAQKITTLFPNKKFKINPNLKSPIFNDKKVSSHFAIVPTGETKTDGLTQDELNALLLVSQNLLAQFHEESTYTTTTVELKTTTEHIFVAKAKAYSNLGWKTMFTKEDVEDESPEEEEEALNEKLPVLRKNDNCRFVRNELKEKSRKAPALFTEGTLIKHLVNSHILIEEDAELSAESKAKYKSILKENKGIGTEATRADIIKKLYTRDYIKNKGKSIIPTELGLELFNLFTTNPQIKETYGFITKPLQTAINEDFLNQIAEGKLNLNTYLEKHVVENIKDLKSIKNINYTSTMETNTEQLTCPKCGKGTLRFNTKTLGCSNWNKDDDEKCDFAIWKNMAQKELTESQILELVKTGRTNLIKGFVSKKTGNKFDAYVVLKDNKTEFEFPPRETK